MLRLEDGGELHYLFNISLLEQDETKKQWEGRIKRSEDIMKTMEHKLQDFKGKVGKEINDVKFSQNILKQDVKFIMSNQLKLQDQGAENKYLLNEVTSKLGMIVEMLEDQ